MKHELLAPAGNIEAGYAALFYGADAIYLGLTKFSARAGADNFTAQELDEITAYAHHLGKKVYVALNTILTEKEMEEMPEVIALLKRTKVDALIIQDLGIYYLLKKLAPEIELHASTQMAVHNLEGAKFLQSLGFKRVVLARELTKAEIKTIATALPDLDLEVFVHGALCYCYSGQCLFSALEFGKSANRGRCVYPCRAIYDMEDGAKNIKGHLFSMKDLALEEKVRDISALSLKIEGRKKSPLYVAAVTNYYRHILDGEKKNFNEAEDIKQIFSRPWCHFHFEGRTKDVTDEVFVGHRGLCIGGVEQIRGSWLKFKTARTVARYDGIQIDVKGDEKPFGFGVKALKVNGKTQFEAKAGQVVELELPEERPHIDLGAPIYLASSTAVKGKYDYDKPKAKEYRNSLSYGLKVEITADKIWAMSEDKAVFVTGEFTPARDEKKTIEAVHKAFERTGNADVALKFEDIAVDNPKGLFAPASLLNELRRQLVLALEQREEKPIQLLEVAPYNGERKAKEVFIKNINFDSDVSDFKKEDLNKVWLRLPQICRCVPKLKAVVEAFYQSGARQFVVENYYGFELLKAYKELQVAAGSFIYVMNRFGAEVLKEMGVCWAMPALESSPENMAELIKTSPLPLVQLINGYPPLFTSAVCIARNDCAHCPKTARQWNLKQGGRQYRAVLKNCQVQLFSKEAYQRAPIDGVYGVCQSY